MNGFRSIPVVAGLRFQTELCDPALAGTASPYLEAWPLHPELFPPPLAHLEEVRARRLSHYNASGMRGPLLSALRAAYARLGLSAEPLLARLADPDCGVIVSGQQAGLLAGPLYTHYKILGSIRLAESLRPPALPVFWNAAEDSDLAEIADVVVPGRQGTAVFHLDVEKYPAGTMAAAVPARDLDLEALLAWWEEHLRRTDFTGELFGLLRRARDASAGLGDWMTRLAHHWYGEQLLVMDPSWPELKPLGLPLVECELAQPNATAADVNAAGQALARAGLSPRIHRPPDRTSFFYVQAGVRHHVIWRDERLHFMDRALPAREFLEMLRDDPTRYSAGATFRPVLQDTLLPTLATVVGPGELAYHCQLESEYRRLSVPRPTVVVRPGATLLEPPAAARLERLGLPWHRLAEPLEALGKSLAAQSEGRRVSELLSQLQTRSAEVIEELRALAACIEAGLPAALDKQGKNLARTLEQIEDLMLRRLRDRNAARMEQLSGLAALLFPDGQPQERRLNLCCFLNKYGPEFLPGLARALPPPGESRHALITWQVEQP